MILLRHGQTVFNLHFSKTRIDPGVPDPPLTPLGETQAREAAERLQARQSAGSSPAPMRARSKRR